MKNRLTIFLTTLLIVVGSSSCKDVVDNIFPGTDIAVPPITISIPAIPPIAVALGELPMGNYYQRLNLDSAVRANTGGAFGAEAVSSIKMKDVTINITDGDENNNLSNFESARVLLTSNSQSNAVELFSLSFPTSTSYSLTHTPTNPPELLPHLKGGELTYQIYGKARKSTSKNLTMTVSVVMKVK
jgi:hypothetical protein